MSLDIPAFPRRSQIAVEIARYFKAEDSALILEILNLYGDEPGELHREWMQIYLLRHTRGDVDLLLRSVEEAKRGYKRFLDKAYSEELGRMLDEFPHIDITLMPHQPPERPLSRHEAVSWMGVSWIEFDRWIGEGKLHPLPMAGRRLFDVADLERLQREREDAA